MHRSRLLVLAGVAVAAIGLLLPQARFPGVGPVDGFNAAAWPVMLPLTPLALVALLGDRPEGLGRLWGTVAVLLSGSALAFAIAKAVDALIAAGAAEGGAVRAGVWVVLAGAALSLVGSLLSFDRRLG